MWSNWTVEVKVVSKKENESKKVNQKGGSDPSFIHILLLPLLCHLPKNQKCRQVRFLIPFHSWSLSILDSGQAEWHPRSHLHSLNHEMGPKTSWIPDSRPKSVFLYKKRSLLTSVSLANWIGWMNIHFKWKHIRFPLFVCRPFNSSFIPLLLCLRWIYFYDPRDSTSTHKFYLASSSFAISLFHSFLFMHYWVYARWWFLPLFQQNSCFHQVKHSHMWWNEQMKNDCNAEKVNWVLFVHEMYPILSELFLCSVTSRTQTILFKLVLLEPGIEKVRMKPILQFGQ